MHEITQIEMLQATPNRNLATSTPAVVSRDRQRQRLLFAIFLLLAAITALLVRDRQSASVDTNQVAAVDNDQPVSSQTVSAEAPAPAIEVSKASTGSEIKATPTALPVRKAPSSTHHVNRPVVEPAKAQTTAKAQAVPAQKTFTTWGPATSAAEHSVAPTSNEETPKRAASSYPLLDRAMAVQGSVLMQALIGVDGLVQDLRVISGPAILVPAARQAVRNWRFKPFLQNGKPVETQARVTVNFAINVSNTEARYNVSSVTSNGGL